MWIATENFAFSTSNAALGYNSAGALVLLFWAEEGYPKNRFEPEELHRVRGRGKQG